MSKTIIYKGRALRNVGLSWYVDDMTYVSGWRWIANSFAAAKRWVSK